MNGFVQILVLSPTCKRRDKKKDDITRYMYIDTITSPGEKAYMYLQSQGNAHVPLRSGTYTPIGK